MSKRNKRIQSYKSNSTAARAHWGSSPRMSRRMKTQQRRLMRLIRKEIEEDE